MPSRARLRHERTMFLCILQMMHYGTQTRDHIKPCKRLVRHTRNIDWQHARALSFCAVCREKTIYLRMQARDHFTEWTISSHQACRVVVWHICTWAWQGAVAPPNRIYRHIVVVERAPSRHYSCTDIVDSPMALRHRQSASHFRRFCLCCLCSECNKCKNKVFKIQLRAQFPVPQTRRAQ